MDSYQVNPAVYIPGTCAAGQYGLTAPGACSTTANQNYRRRIRAQRDYPGTCYLPAASSYGYVDTFDDGGTSSYNGLLLAVRSA